MTEYTPDELHSIMTHFNEILSQHQGTEEKKLIAQSRVQIFIELFRAEALNDDEDEEIDISGLIHEAREIVARLFVAEEFDAEFEEDGPPSSDRPKS